MKIKIKRDAYFKKKGGTAKIINVYCVTCGKLILIYQKDGPGWLKRCYLNRIIWPEKYAKLNKKIIRERDLEDFTCECGNVIGSPMRHKDGRIAFNLIRGNFRASR